MVVGSLKRTRMCQLNCGHCPVLISCVFQNKYLDFNHNYVQQWLWTKGKYDLMSRCLNEIDWVFELTEVMYHKFREIINLRIERYVPQMYSNKKHILIWKLNPPGRVEQDKSEGW